MNMMKHVLRIVVHLKALMLWPLIRSQSAGPPVGDDEFTDFMERAYDDHIFRVVHAGDWIAQVSNAMHNSGANCPNLEKP